MSAFPIFLQKKDTDPQQVSTARLKSITPFSVIPAENLPANLNVS